MGTHDTEGSLSKSTFHMTIRSTHLDRFGHVNNARYLEFLEWARWDWARDIGLDFETLMHMGLDPAVVRIEIDYHRELRFRDEVTILTSVRELGNKRIVLVQEMMRNSERVAFAVVYFVLVDQKSGRSVPIPQEIRERLVEEGE